MRHCGQQDCLVVRLSWVRFLLIIHFFLKNLPFTCAKRQWTQKKSLKRDKRSRSCVAQSLIGLNQISLTSSILIEVLQISRLSLIKWPLNPKKGVPRFLFKYHSFTYYFSEGEITIDNQSCTSHTHTMITNQCNSIAKITMIWAQQASE